MSALAARNNPGGRANASTPPPTLTPAKDPRPRVAGGSSSICPAAAAGAQHARTLGAWCGEWRRLAVQAQSGERDSGRDLQNLRVLSRAEVDDLRATREAAGAERTAWEGELWFRLARVRKRVRALDGIVRHAPQGDVQRVVKAAEHDLQVLAEQQQQQGDELAPLEAALTDALQASLLRFESWGQQESALVRSFEHTTPVRPQRAASAGQTPARSAAKASREPRGMFQVREQLEKLVADEDRSGGATCGWSKDENQTFCAMFRRCKTKTEPDFLAAMQQILPLVPQDRLLEHARCIAQYEERQQAKRQLIDKWRELRTAASVSAKVNNGPTTAELAKADVDKERLQQKLRHSESQQQRAEVQHKLAEWRSHRTEQKQAQEEQRCRLREAQRREVEERRQRREQLRPQLEAFQQQRQLVRCASAPAPDRRTPSREEQERIARRNLALQARTAAQREAAAQAAQARQRRACFDPPARAPAAYGHVESRLLSDADAYVAKRLESNCEEPTAGARHGLRGVVPGNFAHQGVVRTTRSLPAWRRQFGA